jgi:hypothetical protein
MSVVIFLIGIARGQGLLNTFINGFLIMLIANVPQGLPMTVRNAPDFLCSALSVLTLAGACYSRSSAV